MSKAYDHPTFHRHPAHPPPVRRHNQPIILHVTICTKIRGHLLDNERAHAAILLASRQATHWRVGEYVVMPDHIHFFCAPGMHDYPAIRRWAGYWKRRAGKEEPGLRSMFLEDCWDTQIRDRAHYEEKLSYIRQNPVRRGLTPTWEAWPFRGRVFDVYWG